MDLIQQSVDKGREVRSFLPGALDEDKRELKGGGRRASPFRRDNGIIIYVIAGLMKISLKNDPGQPP